MSMYLHDLRPLSFKESEEIPEIDLETLIRIKEAGIDLTASPEAIEEAFLDPPESVKNLKDKVDSLLDLRKQWQKVADKFVMHKWIDRYIKDEKQEAMLKKYYDILCNEETNYGEYKRAFKFVASFFGLPNKEIIIENMVFGVDDKDKGQKKVSIKYSRGMARVNIPDNISLIHISPADNIKELIPSFRSKVKGKYMYPSKRCFFTVAHQIKKTQSGLEKQKTYKYVTKQPHNVAYIDPTYAMFKDGSVYIETEKPIPVERA